MDFVQEMGVIQLTHKWVSFTQQISSLVLICDAKTWSYKKKKGKREEVSVLIVLATGLSLCTEQRVGFVQEMGDWSVRADHPQRSQFHPTNLFLSHNLWCKDLVPQKKGKGKAVSVLIVSATGLSLCTEQRVDFVQEMGDWSVRADYRQRSQFHPTNLFLSLNLCCKDLVLQEGKKKKKKKEKQWVFDCFGHWTVFMHLIESGLCTRDGCLKQLTRSESASPNKSLP